MHDRLRNFYQKLITYWQTHLWCIPVFVIVVVVVFAMLIILSYFRSEYIQYLIDDTYQSQENMLEISGKNMDFLLSEFVQIGSELAINDTLLEAIEDYDHNQKDRAVARKELNEMMIVYSRYSQWISDIVIVSEDQVLYEYDKHYAVKGSFWQTTQDPILFELNDQVKEKYTQRQIPGYVAGSRMIQNPQHEWLDLFFIAFPLKGSKPLDKLEYTMIIAFNAQSLREYLDALVDNENDWLQRYFTNEDQMVIYHDKEEIVGVAQKQYFQEHGLTVFSQPLSTVPWNLCIAIDEAAIKAQFNQIYYRGVILLSLVMVFLAIAVIFGVQAVLRPVNDIRGSIEKVKEGNFNQLIPIKGHHELWQLVEEYNKMIISIREMTERLELGHQETLLSLQKQQEAEREALESQINSHFICNTLGVINYEIIESGNYKASLLIKKLSNILRYTFDQKHQEVFLYQEILWIEQYLFLQKSRLEDMFDYTIQFPEQFEDWPCRKLMLQPFVENSILHGFEGRQQGGMIQIVGAAVEERFQLIISDNGCGMDEKTQTTIRKILKHPTKTDHNGVGIGISNVVSRMYMYYGSQLTVTLESAPDKGTTFTFLIPKPPCSEERNENLCES